MKLTIHIPESVEEALQVQLGPDVGRAAKETLAIAWYQAEKLSIGQVAELLGISVYEAEGVMKRNRVEAPYSPDDFERDQQTLRRILNQ